MAKARDVVSEIQALMPERVSPRWRWHQRLTESQAVLVNEIAEAWRAGQLGNFARPVSKAIAQRLAADGITISSNTVREWLADIKRS